MHIRSYQWLGRNGVNVQPGQLWLAICARVLDSAISSRKQCRIMHAHTHTQVECRPATVVAACLSSCISKGIFVRTETTLPLGKVVQCSYNMSDLEIGV